MYGGVSMATAPLSRPNQWHRIAEVTGSSPVSPTILDDRQNSSLFPNQSVNRYRIGDYCFIPLNNDFLDDTADEGSLFLIIE